MPEYKIRYEDRENGDTYCWDEVKEYWVQVHPVEELPPAIKKKIEADKEQAELLLKVKIK